MKFLFSLFFVIGLHFSINAVQDKILREFGFIKAHEQGITGKGVNILVIDEPVYKNHPSIKGRVTALSAPDSSANELKTHGTIVSSVIVGVDNEGELNGGAPDSHVYVISATDFTNTSPNALPSDVSIVSMSLKYPFRLGHSNFDVFAAKLTNFLIDNDAILVVATGNRGRVMLDRRDSGMDQGILFAEVFSHHPKLRERTVFVSNIQTESATLSKSKSKNLKKIERILKDNNLSSDNFLKGIDTLVEKSFQHIYLDIKSYYSQGAFDYEQFDSDFKSHFYNLLVGKYYSVLDAISQALDSEDSEGDEFYISTLNTVEELIKYRIKQQSKKKSYFLVSKSNRPGKLFAGQTISAPGVGLWVANMEKTSQGLKFTSKTASGTSVSAPMITSAIALLLERYPHFTPRQAAQHLLKTSSETKYPGFFGQGILNLNKALKGE